MYPLLSVLVLVLFFWYLWRVIAPYMQFPSHIWVIEVIGEKFTKFPFQKLVSICQRHMKEGLCIIWSVEPMLVIFGEEPVKILANESEAVDKPKIIYKFFGVFLQKGLFVSNGDVWKKEQKLIRPFFYPSKMKDIEPIMSKNAIAFMQQLDKLNGKATDETKDFLKAFVLKVFSEVVLGMTSDQLESKCEVKYITDSASKIFDFIVYRIARPWLYFDFTLRFSPTAKKYKKPVEWTQSFIKQELQNIKESVCSRKSNMESSDVESETYSSRRKSVAEMLTEHHLKNPSFTTEDLEAQILTLMAAVLDTVANTLSWCFFLLGHDQYIQQRAYREVMSVTGGGEVSYDNLSEMTYLDSIIKETLRLFPPIPMFARLLKKDLQCGKYKIPKNTSIIFFPYLLHRNPDVYPDPEKFNPDRFIEKDSGIKQWTHIPFAESVRPCIGKNFAMMEMKIILAHVLRNFKIISLDRKEDVVITWEILLKSVDALCMQFVRR